MAANGNTTLGGLSFTPADLIEYDRATDTAIVYFAGSSLFDDPAERIISTHILGDDGPAGELLLVVGDALIFWPIKIRLERRCSNPGAMWLR